jgi:hypothetical protein
MNKQLFGLECPGCGMQRAVKFLINGEFTAAFQMFPAIYTLIALGILLGFHFLDRSRNYSKIIIATAILNGAVMIIFYLYKMTNI